MDNKHPALQNACDFIKVNLHLKISMLDLKRHTKYSERSLQLLFKKHLNKSPFEYIEEQRLLKAFDLIKTHKKEKPVTHIAKDVGFNHLGRFSVKFKKRFGVSASDLAKS
jgi:AraC family transcriptional regulator, regulatory protein of adaptative response / methylphosphotriester-DNA alkyltransferase methyltransferase